jgi:glycosyltransferase involved in cell wall biosynthesis
VPVVGYDHGGVGEILGELLPQGRVPLGDRAALAQRVAEFIRQRPAVAPNTKFTLQAMLDQTLAVYEEVAGERATAAGGGLR